MIDKPLLPIEVGVISQEIVFITLIKFLSCESMREKRPQKSSFRWLRNLLTLGSLKLYKKNPNKSVHCLGQQNETNN